MVQRDRYQLSLHATNLPNKGWFRKSSPKAKVKIVSGPQQGTVLGETETINRNLSPDWTKIFFLEFSPSEITHLEIVISDCGNPGSDPLWMGEANFEATSVYQEPGNTKWEQIGRSESSRLYCHIEKSRMGPARGDFRLHLRGLDMKNVEPGAFGLGRSDPFYEVAKKNADYATAQVNWQVVYRSDFIPNNLNPYWLPTTIGLEELCYGKLDWPLKISVYDHNESGVHRKIGEVETTIDELQKRIAVKGNADRDQAISISREGKLKTYGLLCVLEAELVNYTGGV